MAAPVDQGYFDYNTAVNQDTTKQAVPYSTDADIDMKIHKSSNNSDSFPYVALSEDSTTSLSNQLESSYNAHDNTKGEDYTEVRQLQYAMNSVNVDHHDSSPIQQSNAELTINETLLHETNSNSSISYEYNIQENNDGGCISEQ